MKFAVITLRVAVNLARLWQQTSPHSTRALIEHNIITSVTFRTGFANISQTVEYEL